MLVITSTLFRNYVKRRLKIQLKPVTQEHLDLFHELMQLCRQSRHKSLITRRKKIIRIKIEKVYLKDITFMELALQLLENNLGKTIDLYIESKD